MDGWMAMFASMSRGNIEWGDFFGGLGVSFEKQALSLQTRKNLRSRHHIVRIK